MSWDCVGVPWKCEPSIHKQLSFYWPGQSLPMLCITEIVCFSKCCSIPGLCLALYLTLCKVQPCKCHVIVIYMCTVYFSAPATITTVFLLFGIKDFDYLDQDNFYISNQMKQMMSGLSRRFNFMRKIQGSIIALSFSTCSKPASLWLVSLWNAFWVCHVLAAGGEYFPYLNATIQREPQGNNNSFALGNLAPCWPEPQNFTL